MEGKVKVYANLAGVEVGDGFPVRIVGAINVSPESFFAGSVARDRRALGKLAQRMADEGAALLDIGAMSTAPYVRGAIDEDEERKRMLAAVRIVRAAVGIPLSIDTQRASVAAAALEAGADVINDISGLRRDAGMGPVARHARGAILMALEYGPSRAAPLSLIAGLLRQCLQRAAAARIPRQQIVLDPGIGFFRQSKVSWHELDCEVLRHLGRLRRLGQPLLVGVSRKSFIGHLTGHKTPADRLYGSLAAAAIAVANGASLVRAHDVRATVDVVRVAESLRR
ncbi:MAG: dihydropteroate synthase [Deltaproteobacteria bacterium]|nr:dihydropteroate synthase [Deltaproteobacteria bacterium]